MRITEYFKNEKGEVSVIEAYNQELRMNERLQTIEATANGGLKIVLGREDEFGNRSDLKIVIEANEFQLLKLLSLFSDKLV